VNARIHKRRAGFTMIEVLLAMAILLFGMTAILGLLTFGAVLSRTALVRTEAASVAEAVVADLEETLFPLVDGEAGPPREIKDRKVGGLHELIYSAHAAENPARPLEYRVDIEMSWQSGGVRRERRISTLLLREIPFGERLRRQFVDKSIPAPPPTAPPAPAAAAKPKAP
jgi:prepilin-type N-terminal cleavage/methylation domain-containing protein